MLKCFAAGIAATVVMVGAVLAGPLEDGMAAFERRDYATALKLWTPLAEEGVAIAQSGLGFMYESGHGVPQDNAEAAKWYRRAGEQGYAGSQFLLGDMYLHGRGVAQDFRQALAWSQRAADQGNAGGQTNLGLIHAEGLGVPRDRVSAYKWFSLAVAQGSEAAIENRDVVASLMSPDEIAKGQRQAQEWTPATSR